MTINENWYKKYGNVVAKNNQVYDKVELIASKSEQPTLRIGSYFMHSSYDPIKEAKRLAEAHSKEGHFHVLFGFGLGYLARELFYKLGKDEYLLIVEPNIQVFQLALKTTDFSCLIESDRVFFNIGEELSYLKPYIHLLVHNGYLNKVNFIVSPNYNKVYPELKQDVTNLFKETSMLELININTFHHFAKPWQDNFLNNMYQAIFAKPFSSMVKKLSCPVVIAAAGPSLTKQLPLLRMIRDKVFILCAGSAINSLLVNEVKPHAIVTVDGGEANYYLFHGLNTDSIPIIYSFTVHKDIPSNHYGIQFVFNDNPTLKPWIKKLYQRDIGFAKGGQSVANYCLDIACQMTTGPICFIGQDLAYTNNQTHAEGSKNGRTLDIDKVSREKRYTKTTGYYGEQVLTDYVFLGMKRTFEQYIEHLKDIGDNRPIVNATEGGAIIEGAINCSFKQFINEYCRENISKEIENLFNLDSDEPPDIQHFLGIIDEESRKIPNIIKLCQKAKKEFTKINLNCNFVSKQSLRALNKIDKKLKELLEHNLMHYMLQPVIFRVQHRYPQTQNETPEEHKKRVLLISETLYKEILDTAYYMEKCMDKLVEKLKQADKTITN